MKWTWQDAEGIAGDLAALYPDTDPLKIGTRDLERLVLGLPGFKDEPSAVTQEVLLAIQEAWYDLFDAG
jgi:FeS assembly protein IscX